MHNNAKHCYACFWQCYQKYGLHCFLVYALEGSSTRSASQKYIFMSPAEEDPCAK